ncbi:hypothetical protein BC834DRAFT_925798 [Gloeopeniophorella convolvens]|nr:hypothetical protein BC834DRAFT_925798 [Gloeopeniophorella convolvens]
MDPNNNNNNNNNGYYEVNLKFGTCCIEGQIWIPPLPPLPPLFYQLYHGIRRYNIAFAFTSIGIHRALSHRIGGLLLADPNQPIFAWLYIYDPDEAHEHRLLTDNLYTQLYKQAYDILSEKPPKEQDTCAARIVVTPNTDYCCYNLSTSAEIAVIMPGSSEEDIQEHREVILWLRQPQADNPELPELKRISHLHPLYTPLYYVLLFPRAKQDGILKYL